MVDGEVFVLQESGFKQSVCSTYYVVLSEKQIPVKLRLGAV